MSSLIYSQTLFSQLLANCPRNKPDAQNSTPMLSQWGYVRACLWQFLRFLLRSSCFIFIIVIALAWAFATHPVKSETFASNKQLKGSIENNNLKKTNNFQNKIVHQKNLCRVKVYQSLLRVIYLCYANICQLTLAIAQAINFSLRQIHVVLFSV